MKKIICIVLIQWATTGLYARNFNIAEMGAVGDGRTDHTEIIQQAIDRCSSEGGKVVIPAGVFITKPLFLKSNVHIELESGAVLQASVDLSAYKGINGVINGVNVENVILSGYGTLDGQSDHPHFAHNQEAEWAGKLVRPHLVYLHECRNITETGLEFRNSVNWTQTIENCDGVTIRGIRIKSLWNAGNDGLDIDSRNVIVSDCYIESDDDALCFKSYFKEPVENVTVSNCILRTNCSAIKFGTASGGGFKNIHVSNCIIYKASESHFRFYQEAYPWEGITEPVSANAGIALEVVDGGIMEGITISNIVMRDVHVPIFIRLGNRINDNVEFIPGHISELRDVSISHVIAYGCSKVACSITGIPGHSVENVTISDVQMTLPGGGTEGEMQQKVIEKRHGYPEYRIFDVILPAVGFYVRHAGNIAFDQVHIRTLNGDVRPAYYLTDAPNVSVANCTLNAQPATVKRADK
jgi:polygalacturonase